MSLYDRIRQWPYGAGEDRAQLGNLGGMLGNLGGGLGGGSAEGRRGVPAESAKEGADYAGLKWDDFTNTYGANLEAGVWRDLAEYVVGAQNFYNVGWGMADFPEVVGRWFMVLDDGAGNEVVGQARIKTMNSNDENIETESRAVPTSRLNTNASDYNVQWPLPENRDTDKVGEDSKIVIQFKLAGGSVGTSVDFTAAATVLDFPATNYS